MKTILVTTALILININVFSQWIKQSSPFSSQSEAASIYFPTSNIGYIAGGERTGGSPNGIIWKTINGGDIWSQIYIDPATSWIMDIYFISKDTGFAVGGSGRIVKTIDGGTTWTQYDISGSPNLQRIDCPSPDTCFAVSREGSIYRTINGGIDWQKVFSSTASLSSIDFINSKVGIAVGSQTLKTIDGGDTWVVKNNQLNKDISMANTNIGYTIADYGFDIIRKTIDGGETWLSYSTGSKEDLRAIQALDENTVAVACTSTVSLTVIKTIDGANTWSKQKQINSPFSPGATDIFFTDNNNGWVVGNGGIYRTTNGGSSVGGNFTVSTSQTNVTCNGGSNGSATVTPVGGTSPYTYSWAPSGGTNATATGLAAKSYTVTVTDSTGVPKTAIVTITQPLAALSATVTQTYVSCNGGNNGTATAIPTGGTTPYTYSWAPNGGTNATATGLTGTTTGKTYTVTVTDSNKCATTASATITQPTALTTITNKIDVSCLGNGSATTTPSGGTAPYKYSWSQSSTDSVAVNLTAETYTVTVTDFKNCTINSTATISKPVSALSVNITATHVSCYGGNNGLALITPTGGLPPYSHSWNTTLVQKTDTANNLVAGTYTDTVKDAAGCTAIASVTIKQPAALTTSITKPNVSCNIDSAGTVRISTTGGTSPYRYSWAPKGGTDSTAVNLTAGTYTVTVTDTNNCVVIDTVLITGPLLALSATATSSGNNATATASGGVPPYRYLWNTTPVQTTATANNLTKGTYTVTVTDTIGCKALASISISNTATSVFDKDIANSVLSVFPNPTQGVFTLSVSLKEKQEVTIRVFNMQGQLVISQHISNFAGGTLTKELDLSGYPKGIYHLELSTDKGIFNQKLGVE